MKIACLVAIVAVLLVGLTAACTPDNVRGNWDDSVKARTTTTPTPDAFSTLPSTVQASATAIASAVQRAVPPPKPPAPPSPAKPAPPKPPVAHRTMAPPPAPRPAVRPSPGGTAGPSAICKDGTLSYSAHRSGTCSGHHGVAKWL